MTVMHEGAWGSRLVSALSVSTEIGAEHKVPQKGLGCWVLRWLLGRKVYRMWFPGQPSDGLSLWTNPT